MRRYIHLLLAALVIALAESVCGQDTFSIVAVDPETGEVGSAGATCLDVVQEGAAAIIISDVLPGRGAIHTQSFYIPANQANARSRMLAGDSPDEIISWLQSNDAQGNPFTRQYGIVDLDPQGMPRAAAFTGPNCLDYKGHRVGEHYAIQGNILLGAAILDSMEAKFNGTDGSLAEKLMAAMQGANVAGADSRCLAEGVSSRSAFLRVAKPGDSADSLYIDIRVNATPQGVEPIDSLQRAFDALVVGVAEALWREVPVAVYPNPAAGSFVLEFAFEGGGWQAEWFSLDGNLVVRWPLVADKQELMPQTPSGTYLLRILDDKGRTRAVRRVIFKP